MTALIRCCSSWLVSLLLLALMSSAQALSTGATGKAIHVPADYAKIQDAVNAASDGDTVLVADGTYTGDGNRDIDLQGKNITVQSENGPTKTVIDCGGYKTADGSGNHRGFYLHSGEKNVTISGFTVKNGYENHISGIADSGSGGGIFNQNIGGTITLTNCTISGSTALYDGGGIYSDTGNGTTTLANCTVSGNTAGYGGGICNFNTNVNGTITLTNCTVSGNTASGGGGIYNDNSNGGTITLANCTVAGNTAGYGGGICNINTKVYGTITLTNCTVSGNTASGGGGGIFNDISNANGNGNGGTITLTNCTLTGNTASYDGGGIYSFNFNFNSNTITLTNCILYKDIGVEIVNSSDTTKAIITYSDIQGGYPGTGNTNADPQFVNAASGDLHLKPGSPCLGAGTSSGAPVTDLDGNPRPSPPSMGAYELAAPVFALTVTSARMISSHKLAVTTGRVFGTTSYTVTVRLGLKDANGNPLARSQNLTSYSGLPNGDQSPFIFDLKQLNVPRFTKNERFSVTAEVIKDSSGYVRDTKDTIIWLPVVLVPGINGAADLIQGKNVDHPYGGDGTFPNMEAYLKQSSQNYLHDNDCLGEAYYLYQDPAVSPHDYPTLFTLPYDRDNASFAEGADKLSGFISLTLSFTYAAKVEIATHSKGGLVARAYLEYQDDTADHTAMPSASAALVNRLIMTVPPNTGSLWPKLDVIGFGYIDFSNLYPTWPYLRQFPFQKYIYPGKPNQQLTALNADDMYLPKTVSYTIVYTDKYPTPETITVNPLLLKRVPPYIGLTVGDSVVPFYSQEGFLYSPNDAAGPSVMIHPFRDILINHVDIPGFHTSVPGLQSVSYLELPDVENEVFTEIKTDF